MKQLMTALLVTMAVLAWPAFGKVVNEPERLFSKESNITPKTYVVTFKDCQNFAKMLGATGGLRDQGVRKEFMMQSMITEESLLGPAFKVLLPLNYRTLDFVYQNEKLGPYEIETIAFRSCQKYINQSMIYF